MQETRTEPLIIGTRGSRLALWQAEEVQRLLPVDARLEVIRTSGDRIQDVSLQGGSTTGFFTREIEELLLAGDIDLAVHSFKDLPTALDPRLAIAACLARAPVTDLLLVHPDWLGDDGLLPLRSGCRVGAGSLRRQALVRLYRPDANPDLIRGNVPTRVGKCIDGQYGAVVMARAGIERLNLDTGPLVIFELDPALWLPAPAQGAVAVEIRVDDTRARAAVGAIDDPATTAAVILERRLLAAFEGGCHTAFGAHVVADGDRWRAAIGIDRPGGAGWGQMICTGSSTDLAALGPANIVEMSPEPVSGQEALCRPWTP
ncbi:MAG: hydroxymethylbilane synthase [Pseudomonadota bacterium]